jgi:hypothetical protein
MKSSELGVRNPIHGVSYEDGGFVEVVENKYDNLREG